MVTVCGKVEPKLDGAEESVTAFIPPLQVRRNYSSRATPIFFSTLVPFVFDDRTRQELLSSTGTVFLTHRRW